jgi:Phosphotransferase enzyme family
MIAVMDIGPEQVASALGREVSTYTVEAIDPAARLHSVTGGVFRVRGEDFSLVLKVVRNGEDASPTGLWVSGSTPGHRNYWKREWLAYSSGMLDALPGELRAPRTMLATEPSDDECWVWLEDVEGRPGVQWEIDDYDSAAFDLATTQAAYACGRSVLPVEPWLARGWLRSWVETLEHHIGAVDDDSLWHDERLAPLSALRPRLRELWPSRDGLLTLAESAPQTLVHCDLWPANLIAADDGTTVAIDWSQVGIGSVAQDLDQLTLDPVWMQVMPEASLDDLETHVLPGYLSGLRTSGVDATDSDLRRWYAAAASVHYAPMLALQAAVTGDAQRVAAMEARHHLPYAGIVANRARVVERALELGEWALGER